MGTINQIFVPLPEKPLQAPCPLSFGNPIRDRLWMRLFLTAWADAQRGQAGMAGEHQETYFSIIKFLTLLKNKGTSRIATQMCVA